MGAAYSMANASVATATYAARASLSDPYAAAPMAKRSADEERLTEQIRAHIRRLIRTRFETPYALAKQTGIPASTLYHILSGNRGVGIDVLNALHKGLLRSADEFLDEVPEKKFFERGAEYGAEGPRRGRRPRSSNPGAPTIQRALDRKSGAGR
jgi:transcriptional regulator with XRE-family HTH domain